MFVEQGSRFSSPEMLGTCYLELLGGAAAIRLGWADTANGQRTKRPSCAILPTWPRSGRYYINRRGTQITMNLGGWRPEGLYKTTPATEVCAWLPVRSQAMPLVTKRKWPLCIRFKTKDGFLGTSGLDACGRGIRGFADVRESRVDVPPLRESVLYRTCRRESKSGGIRPGLRFKGLCR